MTEDDMLKLLAASILWIGLFVVAKHIQPPNDKSSS